MFVEMLGERSQGGGQATRSENSFGDYFYERIEQVQSRSERLEQASEVAGNAYDAAIFAAEFITVSGNPIGGFIVGIQGIVLAALSKVAAAEAKEAAVEAETLRQIRDHIDKADRSPSSGREMAEQHDRMERNGWDRTG